VTNCKCQPTVIAEKETTAQIETQTDPIADNDTNPESADEEQWTDVTKRSHKQRLERRLSDPSPKARRSESLGQQSRPPEQKRFKPNLVAGPNTKPSASSDTSQKSQKLIKRPIQPP
jgi:hypothetical protein